MASPCTHRWKKLSLSLTGDFPYVDTVDLAFHSFLTLVNKQRINLEYFAICNPVCWFPARESLG